jgi:alanyl-tRNA synthetase
VIDIEGYDMTACGGTHVAHTGEIGIIKILRLDRRGTETRVEFRCGGRALRDYQDKHAVLNQLAADLTCGYQDIDRVVSKLRDELKESQRAAKAAGSLLLDYEAHNLLSAADIHGQVRMVTQVFQDRDVAAVRALASRLAETPGTLVLFGIAGENAHLIMARSADLPMDMNAPLRKALAFLGSERGGGRPDFCQGGGVPADRERVAAALLEARQALIPGEF